METALGAASWILDKLLNKLSDDLVAAYVSSKDLGLNYEKIEAQLLETKAVLHEAQNRDVTNNTSLQGLLEKLSNKAGEAEDAMDELHYFMIKDKLDGTREAVPDLGDGLSNDAQHVRHAVRHTAGNWFSCFSCFHTQADADVATAMNNPHNTVAMVKSASSSDEQAEKLTFDRVAMSNNIKQLIEKIHSLCESIIKLLQISPRSNPQQVIANSQRGPTTSAMTTENKLYGRDAIFCQTIDDITSDMHRGTLTVLPIVGPGGIGKTTFTQYLFNHEKTKQRFPIKVWVCVPKNNFDVAKLTQEIHSCIPAAPDEDSNTTKNTTNLTLLQESIAQRLKSKRFLIVLDDIWECNGEVEWDRLLAPFKKGETNGNMILLTTRLPKIANMVKEEATDPVILGGLEPDGFWKFFQSCVFGKIKDEHDEDDMIDIAKEISDKLKCSPLAAKTVGSLLKKTPREDWKEILENKGWQNLKDDKNIMPALKISYDYLSFRLKKCFPYCGLFPEDHRFHISELTHFWDAMGITDRAEDLVDELVDNGFLIKQNDGGAQYYVLHDLLHELCQIVAPQECLNIGISDFKADKIQQSSIRHISVNINSRCCENIEEEMGKLKRRIDVKNLRSLLIFAKRRSFGNERILNVLKDTFNEIKNLRVLFIFTNSLESLPHNFSKLIHLRYLKIGTLSSISLPSAVSRFYHLNFLNLEDWYGSNDVPKGFNCLVNLRHLCGSSVFPSNIPGVGKMESLEELNEFHVNKNDGSPGFELAELGKLTKLRGSLTVCGLEKVRTKEEAAEAKLKNKSDLRNLKLLYGRAELTTAHAAIEGLQPHPSLKGLEIINHSGTTGPSWLCSDICVTSLEQLFLGGISWNILPSFGRLPHLKHLRLSDIRGLHQLRLHLDGVTKGSFKHLKTFEIHDMPDLVEWVGGYNSHLFSRLETIICINCPNLRILPFSCSNGHSLEYTGSIWFPNLRVLCIDECPELHQLPSIPYTPTIEHVEVIEDSNIKLSYSGSSLCVYGYSGSLAFHNLGKIECMSIVGAPHILLSDFKKLNSLRELELIGDMFSDEPCDGIVLSSVQKLTLGGFSPTERLLFNVFKSLPALSELKMMSSKADNGELVVLQFPSSSLLSKVSMSCADFVLSAEDGRSFQNLTSLHSLRIGNCDMIFSHWSLAESREIINIFPASLTELYINNQQDIRSLALLSNLTSLTTLALSDCSNLTVEGFSPLITISLKTLSIVGCGSVAAEVLSEVARTRTTGPAGSWQLEHLEVDSIAAVLVAPLCSRLSATLRILSFYSDHMAPERFTEEQENALQLLNIVEELSFYACSSLQFLPESLHQLCSLKKLDISLCMQIRSLPKSGFPTSLKILGAAPCNYDLLSELGKLLESDPELHIRFS